MDIKVLDQGEAIASCCNQTLVQVDHLTDRQETLYHNISADMSLLCPARSNDPPTGSSTTEPPTTATEPPTETTTKPPTGAPTATEPPTDQGYTCGGTSGWRRVVFLDMTDPTHNCPSGWEETGYSKRTCGRASDSYRTNFTSLQCPCDGGTSPVTGFLGNDYFCESGLNTPWLSQHIFYLDDQLWDGRDCLPTSSCCTFNNPPYFIKEIGVNTNDDIEGRICVVHNYRQNSNIAIELLEILYVQ